jgi:hypothetical protein
VPRRPTWEPRPQAPMPNVCPLGPIAAEMEKHDPLGFILVAPGEQDIVGLATGRTKSRVQRH